jgi:hypothetical protein
MDKFAPILLQAGVKGMIGKGKRSVEIVKPIKKHKAIYFLAPAGLGALLSTKVKSKELGITHHEGEFSSFSCQTSIPVSVDMEHLKTNFKRGILEIHLPRKRSQKPSKK